MNSRPTNRESIKAAVVVTLALVVTSALCNMLIVAAMNQ